jgi:hypothetical protein
MIGSWMRKLSVGLAALSVLVSCSTPTTPLPVTGTYTTQFPLTEKPISEDGNWVNGGTVGLDWHNVVTKPGLAMGTDSPVAYSDPTAILTGTWGADQAVEATVYSVNPTSSLYQEVEIRLRSQISAHSITGYEILFRCLKTTGAYMQVVRWNGSLGDFTYLSSHSGPQFGVANGDVVKASIFGNTIRVYINNALVDSVNDSTYASGNPGIGFNFGCGTTYEDFGFTKFTAIEFDSQSDF